MKKYTCIIFVFSLCLIFFSELDSYRIEKDFEAYEKAVLSLYHENPNGEKYTMDINKYLKKELQFTSAVRFEGYNDLHSEKKVHGSYYEFSYDKKKNKTTIFLSEKERKHTLVFSKDKNGHYHLSVNHKAKDFSTKIKEIEKELLVQYKDQLFTHSKKSGSCLEGETDDKFFQVAAYGNGVAIIDYSYLGPKDIIIPCSIDGKPVLAITGGKTKGAFESKNIRSVIIPETVEKIGRFTFKNNNIKRIELPELESIGLEAFKSNTIKEISFKGNIKTIDVEAFYNNQISVLDFYHGIEYIESFAFTNNQIEKLDLGEKIKRIEKSAFENNAIQEIVFPSSLRYIGPESFKNNDLVSVTFNQGLKKIRERAFVKNSRLTNIDNQSSLNDDYFSKRDIFDKKKN